MYTGNEKTTPFWIPQYENLLGELNSLTLEGRDILQEVKKGIRITEEAIKRLNHELLSFQFASTPEQIHFYKIIKPAFEGRLVLFNSLYILEMDKPVGSLKELESYFLLELSKLRAFFDQHRFLYQYLRGGATWMDEKIFLATGRTEPATTRAFHGFEEIYYPGNAGFVTARIVGNDLLQEYLVHRLGILQNPDLSGKRDKLPLLWTESKTGLIELAYALQSSGAFNNGKTELKEIIEYLQSIFGVNLGHYPRTFQEILARKTGYTNFLDKLRDKLLLRIQAIEEKYDK